jgi:hypothetical protein
LERNSNRTRFREFVVLNSRNIPGKSGPGSKNLRTLPQNKVCCCETKSLRVRVTYGGYLPEKTSVSLSLESKGLESSRWSSLDDTVRHALQLVESKAKAASRYHERDQDQHVECRQEEGKIWSHNC